MNSQTIGEMLRVLRPLLKDPCKATQRIERYWRDKIAIIWSTDDVHRAANERETVLTENEAREILAELFEHHNSQYGLQWKDVTEAIEQSGKGRDITKRELSRFIHKDIITIQKRAKQKGRA
jgi:hypothetical protein